MKTMAISEFKAKALRVIDEVSKTGQPVLITKRGKPLAELTPCKRSDEKPVPGRLSETLLFEKDIVAPLEHDLWDACG